MVENDTVAWLVKSLLSQVDALSDFSLEFGTALLMNLALRTSGKVKCEETECLELLNALMEHPNRQVRTHVNGTLYSLLSRKKIQEKARMLGLGDAIAASIPHEKDATFGKQLEYLQMQLGSEPIADDHSSDGEEEEEDSECFLEEEELSHLLIKDLPEKKTGHLDHAVSGFA
jgi:hypothetical protein